MRTKSLVTEVPFSGDTLTLFQSIAGQAEDTQLFESKDGNGINNTQSLLFVKSALRVETRGRNVELLALSANGRAALDDIAPKLSALTEITQSSEKITAHFPQRANTGSDSDRIHALSPAEVLRTLCLGWRRLDDGVGDDGVGDDGAGALLHAPGIFSYDFLDQFETLPEANSDTLDFPDAIFWLPECSIIVNHVQKTAAVINHLFGESTEPSAMVTATSLTRELTEIIAKLEAKGPAKSSPPPPPGGNRPDDFSLDLDDAEYCALVEKCKEHIVAGDVFQIVPSRTFSMSCPDALTAYGKLRTLNPSPYLFYLSGPDFTLFGSSPETCVSVKGKGPQIELHPIAGTRPRGYHHDGRIDLDLDNRYEAELKLNEKELAEHMMLVDLARNDVARVSVPGTRRVLKLLEVERYSHVMHLGSVVEGKLKPSLDAIHAYLACMNMGTLVGAPKIEAACLLRKYEPSKRGPYGGAVGYFNSSGELDVAIVIRAGLVIDGTAYVRAGAGVVYDSEPQAEANESRNKAMAVLKAIHLTRTEKEIGND